MFVNVFVVMLIALVAIIFGYSVAWDTRGKRIDGLEKKLTSLQQAIVNHEMENGNLEAYQLHLQKEKDGLLKKISTLEASLVNYKKITGTFTNSTSKDVNTLERSNAIQKRKINDLHIKISNLSLDLKRVKDEKNHLRIKYGFSSNNVNNGSRNNFARKSLFKEASVKQDASAKGKDIGHKQTLSNIKARVSELDFDSIGLAYSDHDLKEIVGIDVITKQKLNVLKITSFAQIASLKENDILTISEVLSIPVDTIENERWVEQARKILSIEQQDINLSKKLNTIASMRTYINPSKEELNVGPTDLHLINTLTPLDIVKLNALSIYNLTQIANLSETDITNITNILGLLKGRIKNEYWMEQARDFLEEQQAITNIAGQTG